MPSAEITKKHIADTMKRLMKEQPLSKISVGEIVKACGISRNSFYYHFQDKYDLVNWIFFTDITRVATSELTEVDSAWDVLEVICRFFYNDRKFYQNAVSVEGQNSFSEYFEDLMKSFIVAHTEDVFEDTEEQDFYISFFLDAYLSALFRWLKDGAKIPPERLAEMMRKAATGVAARIMEADDTEKPKN